MLGAFSRADQQSQDGIVELCQVSCERPPRAKTRVFEWLKSIAVLRIVRQSEAAGL
jgi:hypothetical protein